MKTLELNNHINNTVEEILFQTVEKIASLYGENINENEISLETLFNLKESAFYTLKECDLDIK